MKRKAALQLIQNRIDFCDQYVRGITLTPEQSRYWEGRKDGLLQLADQLRDRDEKRVIR